MKKLVLCLIAGFLIGFAPKLASSPLHAQQAYSLKDSYTKSEHMVPMRDGVKLFVAIYSPKDTSQKYPILLSRTPYSCGPYGPNAYKDNIGPSPLFAKEGYIIVYQDVRGAWMSEGTYVNMRPQNDHKTKPSDIDESSDTYDTIEWLVKNIPNNNGRVGMWGISYPGFYTAVGTIDAHPALKAASPQAPIADWFIGDDFHHNGTLFLPHAFNFFSGFGRARPKPTSVGSGERFNHGTPDGYKFFLQMGPLSNGDKKYFHGIIAYWNEMMEHPNYDSYWQARNTLPHLRNIKPAVMTVGGWFDAEDLYGALNTYKSIEKQSAGAYNILVMGPWFHGGWSRSDGDMLGDVRFGSKTGEFYRENIELPFFNYYLKDKGTLKLPEAYVFETGSNKWKTYEQWPPANAHLESLYLDSNGKLSFTTPADSKSFDEYVSDPSKPVPFINNIAIGMTREYMVDDQRFASRRHDVLVYQTPALTEELTVAGPLTASLFVSTTGTDSDFMVKLIDVYPDDAPDNQPNPTGMKMGGYQMLVRGEPMRARFRNSFERPEAMVPNKVEKIEYVMPDVNHTFLKGHRVMVQLQSSWFPLVDRNPQKFVNIYTAKDSDFQKATQRVYHSSRLVLNVAGKVSQ
ncbi:MAG TPA: CocE/NonD family hydrolase [Blastocatellia bacterium]|nr:CocE/NonD family hydrolase [Blastocatellia bacterium]